MITASRIICINRPLICSNPLGLVRLWWPAADLAADHYVRNSFLCGLQWWYLILQNLPISSLGTVIISGCHETVYEWGRDLGGRLWIVYFTGKARWVYGVTTLVLDVLEEEARGAIHRSGKYTSHKRDVEFANSMKYEMSALASGIQHPSSMRLLKFANHEIQFSSCDRIFEGVPTNSQEQKIWLHDHISVAAQTHLLYGASVLSFANDGSCKD